MKSVQLLHRTLFILLLLSLGFSACKSNPDDELIWTFSESELAEIRVAFDKDGHYSYVGKDNLNIPAAQKTMNLELNSSSSEEQISRVTLHEFGHAPGLMHEHQHPMANIPWKKEAVCAFYYQTNGWSRQEVDRNVLNKYTWESSQHTNYDSKSIMQYPVPSSITTNGFSVPWNTNLSATDKDFIAKMYSPNRIICRAMVTTKVVIRLCAGS